MGMVYQYYPLYLCVATNKSTMSRISFTITAQTRAAEIILSHVEMANVFSRFSINLGFGEDTLEELALKNGIDSFALLAILKVSLGDNADIPPLTRVSIVSVLHYLKMSHKCFKEEKIPHLKDSIVLLEQNLSEKYGAMLSTFFDSYIDDVNEHFDFEEHKVFPYIERLLSGIPTKGFTIKSFTAHHTDIEQKLHDLKSILVKYLPVKGFNSLCVNVLLLLVELEQELMSHSIIEDMLLTPAVGMLEKELKGDLGYV